MATHWQIGQCDLKHPVCNAADVQAPSGPKQLDYRKRKELALRNHLDTIAESLSQARAAGQAAGAPAGGLGFGEAWPAPTSGKKGGAKELKQTKAVVRNAERPATPVHAPPPQEDEAHRAAALLQRLLRGRAIQNDMLDAADARAALLTELMTPLRSDWSAAASVPMREARVAAMVAAALQPILMCAHAACAAVNALHAPHWCSAPRDSHSYLGSGEAPRPRWSSTSLTQHLRSRGGGLFAGKCSALPVRGERVVMWWCAVLACCAVCWGPN